MTTRIILLPHVLFIFGAIVWFLAAFVPGWLLKGRSSLHPGRGKSKRSLKAIVLFLWIFLYPFAFLYLSEAWLRAEPTPGWQEEIGSIDTLIVLGFGFEKDARDQLQAGRSNEFLLRWALEHTQAHTFLVQEGVLAAYAAVQSQQGTSGKKMERIHRHIEGIDMNTFQTAYCALERMDSMGKRQAVLVAHDLQLQRAAWIFEKLKTAKPDWEGLRFVVPEIPPTPFPTDSDQLRTRWKPLYIFCELFGSRLRDHMSSAPESCRAPL
jgi:uncharacterized SAM-binding protein YcdF (DUF218 family)